jgi:E-phenylitaconyl-CoA hydratase
MPPEPAGGGAGPEVVVRTDVVVAEPGASFLDSHVNVGMVGAIENIQLLDRLPLGTVMMMTLAGRGYRLTAQRAYELGLVDVLAAPGGAMAEAGRLAALIAQNSPSAVTASKRAIWHAVRCGHAERLSLGWQLLQQQWEHPDFAEGAAAFAARRAPVWAEPTEPSRST